MANLGQWVQELVLKTDGFTSGIKTATTAANDFKAKTSKTLGDVTKSLGLDLQGLAGKISPLMGPIGAGFESLVGKVAGLSGPLAGAAVAGVAFSKWALGILKDIGSVGKAAERIGSSVEGLQNLRMAGQIKGVDADTMTMGLDIFQRRIGQARESLAMGQDSGFTRALQRLNIDAREFSQLPTDEAFQRMVRGLAGVSNTSDRAALAQDLLGRQSRDFLELIGSGGTIFETAAQKMRTFGTALSAADVAKARDATKAVGTAFASVSMTIESVSNSIALAVAPIISAVSKTFERLVTMIQPAVKMVRDIIGRIGDSISVVVDIVMKAIDPIIAIGEGIFEVVGAIWDGIMEATEPLRSAFKTVAEMMMGVKGPGEFIRTLFANIAAVLKGVFSFIGQVTRVIADGIVWLANKLKPLFTLISAGWDALKRIALGVKSFFASIIETITFGLVRVGNQAENAAERARSEAALIASMSAIDRAELDAKKLGPRMIDFQPFGEWERHVPNSLRSLDLALEQAQRIEAGFARVHISLRVDDNAARVLTDKIKDENKKLLEQIAVFRLNASERARWLQSNLTGANPDDAALRAVLERNASLNDTLRALELEKKINEDIFGMSTQLGSIYQRLAAFNANLGVGQQNEALRIAQRQAQFEEQIVKLRREGALADIERLRAARAQLDAESDIEELAKRALSFRQQLQTPGEKFREQIAELSKIREASDALEVPFFSDQQHMQAIGQAFDALVKSVPQIESPKALQQGSVEAVSAINRAMREARESRADPQEQIRKILEAEAQRSAKRNEFLRDLLDAVRENQVEVLS